MSNDRPSLFIGCSSEASEYAGALAHHLEAAYEVTVWHEGVFQLSATTIESLELAVRSFDYAALLLTPDDLIESRSHSWLAPRDNILFELGWFMGGLSRRRVAIVIPKSTKIKMPTDLLGISCAVYDDARADSNVSASMSRPAQQLRHHFQKIERVDPQDATCILYPDRTTFLQHVNLDAVVRNSSRVAICGISLNNLLLHVGADAIQSVLIHSNSFIRLLFQDPDSHGMAIREEEENYKKGTLIGLTKSNIDVARKVRDDCARADSSIPSRMQIRLYGGIPRASIHIFDRRELVIQLYMAGNRGADSPTLHYKCKGRGNTTVSKYLEVFDQMWEHPSVKQVT